MQKTVDYLSDQLQGIRPDINESLIETIRVECGGNKIPLRHLGLVVQHGRVIRVTPFDKTGVSDIAKKLQMSGFDAYKFSKDTVAINIPLPCEENRKKVSAQIGRLREEAKVAIRQIRKKHKDSIDAKDMDMITQEFNRKIDDAV